MEKTMRLGFGVMVLLALMPGMARADLAVFLQNVNTQAAIDIRSFNDRLSVQFGVSLREVDVIVKAVAQPADAFMVLQLSQMAHVEPRLVLQRYQRSQSKGWGALAQELGIKPGSRDFHRLKNGDLSFSGVGMEEGSPSMATDMAMAKGMVAIKER